jgi:hypothetical protein
MDATVAKTAKQQEATRHLQRKLNNLIATQESFATVGRIITRSSFVDPKHPQNVVVAKPQRQCNYDANPAMFK